MFVNNIKERVLAFKDYINNIESSSEVPTYCELNNTEDESPPIEFYSFQLFQVLVSSLLNSQLFEFLMVSLLILGTAKASAWLILQVINHYTLPLESPKTLTEEVSREVVNKCTKMAELDVYGHPVFPFMPGLHFYEDTKIIYDDYEIDENPDLNNYSGCPFILFFCNLVGCR